MENFWKWLTRVAGAISILLFLKSWRSNMESMKLFWDSLTPWQFLFFLVLIAAFFGLWRWRLRVGKNNPAKPVRVIRNPEGYQYLVEGNSCFHIPDPETFNYLGSYFGFSWADSELMLPDDIKSKFTIGKALPSIRPHCPKMEQQKVN